MKNEININYQIIETKKFNKNIYKKQFKILLMRVKEINENIIKNININ